MKVIADAISLERLILPVEITSKLTINGLTDLVKLGRKNNPELEEIGLSKQDVKAIEDSFFEYVDFLLKNNPALLTKILEYVNYSADCDTIPMDYLISIEVQE